MRGELAQRLAAADVHHRRGAVNAAARLLAHLGELQNQVERKIVHTVVAKILEGLENGALPGTAQPGDEHELFRALLRGSFLLHEEVCGPWPVSVVRRSLPAVRGIMN